MTSLPSRPPNNGNNDSITQNHLRIQTTLENDNLSNNIQVLNERLSTDPETRMTMNFNRETVGFDNKQFDIDEQLIR
jgi:hypothetical protein